MGGRRNDGSRGTKAFLHRDYRRLIAAFHAISGSGALAEDLVQKAPARANEAMEKKNLESTRSADGCV